MGREIEDVLIICSDNLKIRNREVYEEIAKTHNWDKLFRLLPGKCQNFRDTYFDTVENSLQKMRVSLRVRQLDGENIITLKIPSRNNIITGRNDLEIERHWTVDALASILSESTEVLRNAERHEEGLIIETIYNRLNQVMKHRTINFSNKSNFVDFFQHIGFQVIQDRITYRLTANVVSESNSKSEILAELALESVAYNINSKNVWHYDIEIEEKSANGSSARETIFKTLMSSDYGSVLKNWKYGKLALGKGLENLIKIGYLHEHEFDNLTLRTYNKIEEMIKSGLI